LKKLSNKKKGGHGDNEEDDADDEAIDQMTADIGGSTRGSTRGSAPDDGAGNGRKKEGAPTAAADPKINLHATKKKKKRSQEGDADVREEVPDGDGALVPPPKKKRERGIVKQAKAELLAEMEAKKKASGGSGKPARGVEKKKATFLGFRV